MDEYKLYKLVLRGARQCVSCLEGRISVYEEAISRGDFEAAKRVARAIEAVNQSYRRLLKTLVILSRFLFKKVGEADCFEMFKYIRGVDVRDPRRGVRMFERIISNFEFEDLNPELAEAIEDLKRKPRVDDLYVFVLQAALTAVLVGNCESLASYYEQQCVRLGELSKKARQTFGRSSRVVPRDHSSELTEKGALLIDWPESPDVQRAYR